MNFVYILQSEKNGRHYISSINDLERRLAEQNFSKTKSLMNLLPVKLVFKKEFAQLIEARRTEQKLKKMKSRSILERIIADGDIKSGR